MNDCNEIDILKKFFSCSSENVFILSYDFEVIWFNRDDLLKYFSESTFSRIMKNEKKPLESREYFLKYNGMEFPCRIINYPESQLYVVQMSGDDSMFTCLKSEAVRHFFSNQTAQVRESVAGIVSAIKMFRTILDEKSLNKISDYLDIASGKCCRLLKSVTNPNELLKYIDDAPEPRVINLTEFLENFTKKCVSILKKQITVNLSSEPDIYISADYDRLLFCLLSLVVLAGKSVPDCGKIFLTADKVGDHVSLTVSSEPNEKKTSSGLFSKFEPLYGDAEADPDMFVAYRFCRTYNGMFYIADDPNGTGKVYSIRLPLTEDGKTLSFSSEVIPYSEKSFSLYHIILSEIADIL